MRYRMWRYLRDLETSIYWMIRMYQRHDIPAASSPPPELVVPRTLSTDPVAGVLMDQTREMVDGVRILVLGQ